MVLITVTKAEVGAFLAALQLWGPFTEDDRWDLGQNASTELKRAVEGRTIVKGKGGLIVQFLKQDWGETN